MIMDPWESLEIDDSELPSLLRPCHHRLSRPIPATSHPVLTPSPQPTPKSTPPDLVSVPSSSPAHPLRSQLLRPPRRRIPGPAGAVQAAMEHKTKDNRNFSCPEANPVPTQEYIKMAVEDAHEDDDFKRRSWHCALSFIRQFGDLDGVVNYTPLSDIREQYAGKVDRVVAVIKSCTPNGLGDMMATLKDPSGTVGASIHRNVLTDGELAKNISVGSVLILHKVSVFSPLPSIQYLNITTGNIVKVIANDVGVQMEQSYFPSAEVSAAWNADPFSERRRRVEILQGSQEGAKTDRTTAVVRQNIDVRGSLRDVCPMETRESCSVIRMPWNAGDSEQHHSLDVETLLQRKVADKIDNTHVHMDTTDDEDRNHSSNMGECSTDGIISRSIGISRTQVNSVEKCASQEAERADGVQTERAPLTSKPSLLQWTDEQLSQLFAVGGEDDDSLFA